MASEPIHIHDDSELAPILDSQSEKPVILERKGTLYRVTAVKDDGPPDDWDPEAFRNAVNDVAGIFTDEEADDMIKKIYEYRRIGSRPASRP